MNKNNIEPERKIGYIQLEEGTFRFELHKVPNRTNLYYIYALGNKDGSLTYSNMCTKSESLSHLLFYQTETEGIKIAGMYVPPKYRGGGIIDALLDQLFRISESLHLPIVDTVVIRKPLIAKKLMSWGFSPTSSDISVELTDTTLPIPIIKYVSGLTEQLTARQTSKGKGCGKLFYQIDESAMGNGSIVPLLTSFSLTNPIDVEKRRMKLMERFDGKVRSYPARVKKILALE